MTASVLLVGCSGQVCFVVYCANSEKKTFQFSGTHSVTVSLVWNAIIDFQGTYLQLLFSFEFWMTKEFGGTHFHMFNF